MVSLEDRLRTAFEKGKEIGKLRELIITHHQTYGHVPQKALFFYDTRERQLTDSLGSMAEKIAFYFGRITSDY